MSSENTLRTLKDLIRYCSDDADRKSRTGLKQKTRHTGYIKILDYNELKAEAVKWITLYDRDTSCYKFILNFFNLTEEDLKGEK